DVAIRHAEAAVGDQPQVAAYRLLLGQSYLKGGRFASARDVFADVLSLDDSNGKVALNLALAQIATGDWAGARKTLDTHAATIPVADRGLAI
ncbi:tetratricopeptide repeat protein, partial [Acinetobacter baumannii]